MFYAVPYLILNLLVVGQVAYFVLIKNNIECEKILRHKEYLKSEEFRESQSIQYVMSLEGTPEDKPQDNYVPGLQDMPQTVSIVQDPELLEKLRDVVKRDFFLPKEFNSDTVSAFRVIFTGDSIQIYETKKSTNEELRRLAMRAVRSGCNECYKDFVGCQIDICFVCAGRLVDLTVSDAWVNTVQER